MVGRNFALPDLYDESREANVLMALCKDCHSALIASLTVANPDGTRSILYGVENGVPDEMVAEIWRLRLEGRNAVNETPLDSHDIQESEFTESPPKVDKRNDASDSEEGSQHLFSTEKDKKDHEQEGDDNKGEGARKDTKPRKRPFYFSSDEEDEKEEEERSSKKDTKPRSRTLYFSSDDEDEKEEEERSSKKRKKKRRNKTGC
jgi:hypothetical protein